MYVCQLIESSQIIEIQQHWLMPSQFWAMGRSTTCGKCTRMGMGQIGWQPRMQNPDPGRDSRRTKLLVWVKGRRYYRAGRLVKPVPCSIKTRIVGRYEGYITINPRAAARSRGRACRLYYFNEHFPIRSFHPNYAS
jgi:hypothetical protein